MIPTAPTTRSPLANLRDLGGLPVSGGTMREHQLWRADDPTLAPADEWDQLTSRGVTTVLDLRSSGEVTASPHHDAERLGIAHHHLPLAEASVNPIALLEAAPAVTSAADVGRWYAGLVRSHAHEVTTGLEVISTSEGGVLFHCAAGKDRTGILAGVVLMLMGAPRDVIVEDYAHTAGNLTAILKRLQNAAYIAHQPAQQDEQALAIAEFFSGSHPLLGAARDSMDSMLTELGGEHGMRQLLEQHTDSHALVDRLRHRLVH